MGSAKPDGDKPGTAAVKSGRCPICTAPAETGFRPFCSRRCSDVDLSRWLRGAYAIPGRADVDEDGEDTAAATTGMPAPRDDGKTGNDEGRG